MGDDIEARLERLEAVIPRVAAHLAAAGELLANVADLLETEPPAPAEPSGNGVRRMAIAAGGAAMLLAFALVVAACGSGQARASSSSSTTTVLPRRRRTQATDAQPVASFDVVTWCPRVEAAARQITENAARAIAPSSSTVEQADALLAFGPLASLRATVDRSPPNQRAETAAGVLTDAGSWCHDHGY